MRPNKILKKLLGLGPDVVITGYDLHDDEHDDSVRPHLQVRLRRRVSRRGPCGTCHLSSPWHDQGDGERSWRHIDVGYATCELIADARRVNCPVHGATVAAVPWARHATAFTRAFEDVLVLSGPVGA